MDSEERKKIKDVVRKENADPNILKFLKNKEDSVLFKLNFIEDKIFILENCVHRAIKGSERLAPEAKIITISDTEENIREIFNIFREVKVEMHKKGNAKNALDIINEIESDYEE